MIRENSFLSIAIAVLFSTIAASAQTWDGGGDATYWDGDFGAENWDSDVIPSSTNVIFNTNAGDTGVFEAITITSLTFSSNVTNAATVITAGGSLTVNNAITNNSIATQSFDIGVSAGSGTIAWDGPLNFKSIVNAGVRQVSLSGNITFTNSTINLNINSLASYGRFNVVGGSVTFSGTTRINLNEGTFSAYAAGNTFDFSNGNFSGATLGNLPALSGGLTWDTSNFTTAGIISVIPEPSSYAALVGAMALCLSARRKCRKLV